jgi:ATP-binding cassette subfamily B protein
MRQSPLLMLLDEPSSALDPESEEEILSGYVSGARELGRRGGLTVIVSHRMSTVRRVDRIVYMHDGQVVEDGTHEELMALDGRYAQMFELQARAYR